MNLNKGIVSLVGSISKYKALAIFDKVTFSLRDMLGTENFQSIPNCREKLQIIYANIRV